MSSATVRGLAPDDVRTAALVTIVKLSPRDVLRAGDGAGSPVIPGPALLAFPLPTLLLLLLLLLLLVFVRNEADAVSSRGVVANARPFLSCTCLDMKPCSASLSFILLPVEDSCAIDGRNGAAAASRTLPVLAV